jgi:hypothetical protein
VSAAGAHAEAQAEERLRQLGRRIDRLLQDLQASGGPLAWRNVEELMAGLLELYGAGLARLLAHGSEVARDVDELERRVSADQLLSCLLALHGIHPLPLEARVRRAIAAFGDLDASIEDGVVTLRPRGGALDAEARALLHRETARAIADAAPEVSDLRVEWLPASAALIPIDRLRRRGGPPA